MELKNGYKVIYDKATNGEHIFYASKTGAFADAEEIVKVAAGEYKLIYEKAGHVYGSKTGIPAEGDHCFEELNVVFTLNTNESTDMPTNVPAEGDKIENEPIELPEGEPTIETPAVEEESEF